MRAHRSWHTALVSLTVILCVICIVVQCTPSMLSFDVQLAPASDDTLAAQSPLSCARFSSGQCDATLNKQSNGCALSADSAGCNTVCNTIGTNAYACEDIPGCQMVVPSVTRDVCVPKPSCDSHVCHEHTDAQTCERDACCAWSTVVRRASERTCAYTGLIRTSVQWGPWYACEHTRATSSKNTSSCYRIRTQGHSVCGVSLGFMRACILLATLACVTALCIVYAMSRAMSHGSVQGGVAIASGAAQHDFGLYIAIALFLGAGAFAATATSAGIWRARGECHASRSTPRLFVGWGLCIAAAVVSVAAATISLSLRGGTA